MKYTAFAGVTAGLVAAAAGAYGQHEEVAWTPATQTEPPVAGFTLRPTPTLRVPRGGLHLRDDDDDDDDDDDGDRKITRGSATSGSVTSAPRPSNTCGWDKNGGGFYACADSRSSCLYTNGLVGCCSGDKCKKIPKKCVEQSNKCDSDDNGGTLCCRHTSAPACYTWLVSTSTAGKQETYSMFACSDKAGTGTLLPTDPASSSSNSNSSSSNGSGGSSTNTGAIVGGIVGGLLALLVIALFVWYFMRQRQRGREEDAAAARHQRQSDLSHASWVEARDGEKKPPSPTYGLYEAVPRRKAVAGSDETQDRSVMGAASGYTSTTATATDRDGTGSPHEHLAYSVSSASMTGSQAGTAAVSSLSPVQPPLEGVVEAPDTGMERDGGAPVEVAGTTVTRESMHSRAELP